MYKRQTPYTAASYLVCVFVRAPSPSTTAVNIHLATVQQTAIIRLEPHCQILATRSEWKEVAETAVALPHSQECSKDIISPLLFFSSKEEFGDRPEIRNALQEKCRGRGGSSYRVDPRFVKKDVSHATQVRTRSHPTHAVAQETPDIYIPPDY